MRLAAIENRATLIVDDTVADVATASQGRFGPDPTYEEPIPAAAEIAGMLSFYPGRTQISVDGEPVES